jgi:hypothetical protein
MQEQRFSIAFDTTGVEKQVAELSDMLRHVFPDGIPNDLVENIPRLLLDVVLSDGGTALGTDGIGQRLITLKIGSGFEHLMAALRTGKISEVIHTKI